MTVLVTGAAGFIGKALCRELLKRGYRVRGVDLTIPKICGNKYMDWREWDITTKPKMEDWNDVDFCFHLAAMANVDEVRVQRQKAFDVNIRGTFNVIEACRKRHIPLAFVSTACVYGHTSQHPSTEDGPTFPVDWYGVTKRAGEELVKGLLDNWLILRYGTTLGAEMRPALCTYIFLKQAIKGESFTIKGTGTQTRNFIFIDDLVEGNIRAMEYHLGKTNKKLMGVHGKNQIFNLVGKESVSILDLADICYHVTGRKICKFEYFPDRPDDVPYENVSIKKAEALLGWQPRVTIKEAMQLIYEEWKRTGKIKSL